MIVVVILLHLFLHSTVIRHRTTVGVVDLHRRVDGNEGDRLAMVSIMTINNEEDHPIHHPIVEEDGEEDHLDEVLEIEVTMTTIITIRKTLATVDTVHLWTTFGEVVVVAEADRTARIRVEV